MFQLIFQKCNFLSPKKTILFLFFWKLEIFFWRKYIVGLSPLHTHTLVQLEKKRSRKDEMFQCQLTVLSIIKDMQERERGSKLIGKKSS